MFESVQRLPRSYSESTSWTPDWRNRQAMAYLAAFRDQLALETRYGSQEDAAPALLNTVRLPPWEDDRVVMLRFLHAAGSPVIGPNWTAAFNVGEQLIRMNPEALEAASIKAWLLVHQTDEEIAARHSLTPFHVKVFHDTWFDVRAPLSEREMLLRILCEDPSASDPDGWQQRECRILRVALACGIETLDRLLVLNEDISDEHLEWLAETRRKVLNKVNREQAKARKANANPNSEKFRQFTKGLLTACDRHGKVS